MNTEGVYGIFPLSFTLDNIKFYGESSSGFELAGETQYQEDCDAGQETYLCEQYSLRNQAGGYRRYVDI